MMYFIRIRLHNSCVLRIFIEVILFFYAINILLISLYTYIMFKKHITVLPK